MYYDKKFLLYLFTTSDYVRKVVCQNIVKNTKLIDTKVLDYSFDDDTLIINILGIDENQNESVFQIVFA